MVEPIAVEYGPEAVVLEPIAVADVPEAVLVVPNDIDFEPVAFAW